VAAGFLVLQKYRVGQRSPREYHRECADASKEYSTKSEPPHIALIVGRLFIVGRRLFIVGLFIQWVRLMSGLSFTWTVWLGYILMVLCLLEVLFDPIFKKQYVRPVLVALISAWVIWFSVTVTLARPNLEYRAWTIPGDYPEGQVIGGIEWRSAHFTDLRFTVVNLSDDDYDNLSIQFMPDIKPAAIGQVSELPGVTFINHNSISEAHSSGIGPDGKPFDQELKPSLTSPEVICSKLGPGEVLQVVMAIVNAPINAPDLPDGLYGPKITPQKMMIKIKLKKGQQPLSISGTLDIDHTK
jgi:hypothetical protein